MGRGHLLRPGARPGHAQDLGLNADNPATPKAVDPAVRQNIDDFLAKQDVDEIALAATVVEIKALADTVLTFADAVKADGVGAEDVFWLIFKVWVCGTRSGHATRARTPSVCSPE